MIGIANSRYRAENILCIKNSEQQIATKHSETTYSLTPVSYTHLDVYKRQGGGIKVSRMLLLVKTIRKELQSIAHPRSIKKIKMDGHPVEHEVMRSINVFFITYMVIFAVSVLIISFNEFSLETNFTAVAATLNNIGPGMDLVGPMSNYAAYGVVSKAVLIFDMIAGRLELFPVLILFCPSTWKKRG